MFKKRPTYSEFLKGGENIATNVLADRLVRLVKDGIIVKEVTSPGGGATRYRLTPRGIDLLPVMLDIVDWAAKHDPETAVPPAFVRRLRSDRADLERESREALTAQSNAHIAEPAEQLANNTRRARRRRKPPTGGKGDG